jgi:hypothetical protein
MREISRSEVRLTVVTDLWDAAQVGEQAERLAAFRGVPLVKVEKA